MKDVNHIQPTHEFMILHQKGHEFVSDPENNPACPPKLRRRRVILSDFFGSATEELFFKKLTADS